MSAGLSCASGYKLFVLIGVNSSVLSGGQSDPSSHPLQTDQLSFFPPPLSSRLSGDQLVHGIVGRLFGCVFWVRGDVMRNRTRNSVVTTSYVVSFVS